MKIKDEEFEEIETQYLKYQNNAKYKYDSESESESDFEKKLIKKKKKNAKRFNDSLIKYFYIIIFRTQMETKGLNHAITYLITNDNKIIEINHYTRGTNPLIIRGKFSKETDPIYLEIIPYLKNTYKHQSEPWEGGIIYKGKPKQKVSLHDVYKRVVLHVADFDMGRLLIKGDYFFNRSNYHTTTFPGSCTGLTETIFHMLSPYIYENEYEYNLYKYNKHDDYENMFYDWQLTNKTSKKKSTKKTSKKKPTNKTSKKKSTKKTSKKKPTNKTSKKKSTNKTSKKKSTNKTSKKKSTNKTSKKKSTKKTSKKKSTNKTSKKKSTNKTSKFSFTKKTSRRRKPTKKTSSKRKPTKKTSSKRKPTKKTSRKKKPTKKTSRRRKPTKKTSSKKKSIS
jgi:hypothetical protein